MSVTTSVPAERSRKRFDEARSAQRRVANGSARGEIALKRELLVNVGDFETRVALVEDGRLVELSVERAGTERMVGDIYKGKVAKVLAGMQSAFVDIGAEKAAFLHSSDMGREPDTQRPSEWSDEEDSATEIIRKKRREAIEKVVKDKQEILVQVIKEPIGSKGPRISTDISIPGRYVVLVPDSSGVRVSKKISSWNESRRLRKIVEPLRPVGFGLICRTESEGRSEKDFIADIKRLLKIWSRLERKAEAAVAPALIHKEEEMTLSFVRDTLNESIDRIVIDDRKEFRRLLAYTRQVTPHLKDKIEFYKGEMALFDQYDIEREIEKMLERKVWMRKGSYLVIDQTEAMITIDVNTGRYVGKKDQEETIFRTNIESAKEIARQLRLRDMGGLIVCDFIDMYNRDNRRKLFEEFKRELSKDRAKKAVTPVSDFGLIELTRQRVRPSLVQTFSEPCSYCNGFGRVLSRETMGAKIDRWFKRSRSDSKYKNFHLIVNPGLGDSLIGDGDEDHNRLRQIMKRYRVQVNLVRDTTIPLQEFRVFEAEGNTNITELYN